MLNNNFWWKTLLWTIMLNISIQVSQASLMRPLDQCYEVVSANSSPVLLNKLDQVKFWRRALTTGRRSPPVRQLRCRGPHCMAHAPHSVHCTNLAQWIPHDLSICPVESQVRWSCEAPGLDPRLRLWGEKVYCEGWNARMDKEYMLCGSCALEHRLVLAGRPG